MKVYSRKHQSAQKWKNLVPYVLTFCLVGALIGFFILQFRQVKKTADPAAVAVQKSTAVQEPAAKADAKTVAQPINETNIKDEDPNSEEEIENLNPASVAPVQTEIARATVAAEEKKEEKFSIEALEVYFLEISKPMLTQLIQEGTVLNESGTGMALWIPNKENTRSTALQKGRSVTDQIYRQMSPTENTPLKILYQGGIKKDDEILFQMQISPKSVDDKRIRLHVNGAMKWLVDDGDGKSSTSSSFDSTYNIAGEGQLILTGVIPQGKKPSKETREVLDKTPLGILNSEAFQGKTSELMIVISVK